MENEKSIYFKIDYILEFKEYFKEILGINKITTGTVKENKALKVDYDFSVISLEEVILRFFKFADFLNKELLEKEDLREKLSFRGSNIVIYYEKNFKKNKDDEEVVKKLINYGIKNYKSLKVNCEKIVRDDFIENQEEFVEIGIKSENIYPGLFKNRFYLESFENINNVMDNLEKITFDVMKEKKTEKPFSSKLNDLFEKGIYVDIITKEPLFSSRDKFNLGFGWPSFSRPINVDKVQHLEENVNGNVMIEIRSISSDSHIGYVFADGKKELGGLRYSVNGAALLFVPYDEMEEKGYEDFLLFC